MCLSLPFYYGMRRQQWNIKIKYNKVKHTHRIQARNQKKDLTKHICLCSRSGDNDAKPSHGTSARSSDDSRVRHHGVPTDRQLLGERWPPAQQLIQVPRRRLRRRRSEDRPVRSEDR